MKRREQRIDGDPLSHARWRQHGSSHRGFLVGALNQNRFYVTITFISMVTHPLIEKFERAGQGQVFAFFNELPHEGQRRLIEEAREIDLDEVARLTRTLLAKGSAATINLEGLAPAPYERRPEHGGDPVAWQRAKVAGEDALRAGRVAACSSVSGLAWSYSFIVGSGSLAKAGASRRFISFTARWTRHLTVPSGSPVARAASA